MRATMLRFASLCLFLYCMLPIDSNPGTYGTAPKHIGLDMVDEAVDDMYDGCIQKMDQIVTSEYSQEKNKFMIEWQDAQRCTTRAMKLPKDVDEALTKDHFHAICLHTASKYSFYMKVNEAVRTSRNSYSTSSFPYHSLHFLLTRAIQILQPNQFCRTTYRRTEDVYTGEVNQIIRFGFFASSSLKAYLTEFGKETCFEIKTCYGADLKDYPEYPEEEVLIPPYETFKITKVIKGKDRKPEGLIDCKLVYILESEGVLSNLNCKAAGRD